MDYNIIGASESINQVLQRIDRVSTKKINVLIRGETGTGKELFARRLHHKRGKDKRSFFPVNCASLTESLIESELFGHERGAYTGAHKNKDGMFLTAASVDGTIFFDEIAELSIESQSTLFRALQEEKVEVRAVGSDRVELVDVRIVYATNQNLEEQIRMGLFRKELYFRINNYPIFIPPLRDRDDDVIVLAEHFRAYFSDKLDRQKTQFSTEAIYKIRQYSWPGNVRELESAIKRAVVDCEEDGVIRPADIVFADFVFVDNESAAPSPTSLTPSAVSTAEARAGRTGPPLPTTDPLWEWVERDGLVDAVREEHLRKDRVAVLLETHRGGGKTLSCQIARRYTSAIWLTADLPERCNQADFYSQLTGTQVVDRRQFLDWLSSLTTGKGETLVVLLGARGPRGLLEEMANALLKHRQDGRGNSAILVVGGKQLLSRRSVTEYFLHRLLAPCSYFDVPDLTVAEIASLLKMRRLECSAHDLRLATGGHPWLVYLLLSGPGTLLTELHLTERMENIVSTHLSLDVHLADRQAREVLSALVRGEPVARLGSGRVRWNPEIYAEARMYFDGLLLWGEDGATKFRCPAIRSVVAREVGAGPLKSGLNV